MNRHRPFSLRLPLWPLLLFFANLCGCISTFSELQSAKLLGPGRYELTPSISAVTWHEEDDYDDYSDTRVGLQLGAGITPKVDWRVRYERVGMEKDGYNIVGFGPKFSLLPDRLAFYAPLGFAFGEDLEASETLEFHPTMLFTWQPNPHVELNASGKVLLRKEGDALMAYNLGLGLSPDFERQLTIRPEIGILTNPGEPGYYQHLSLALSVPFGE